MTGLTITSLVYSNVHLVCYLVMVIATIQTGGLLYIVYPLMLLLALTEETKPSIKWFWIVVCISECLVVIQVVG